MQYLKLSDLKKQLNIDEWFTDDDAYIFTLGDTAEQMVANHIDRPLEDCVDEYGRLALPIKLAIQMLVGHWFRTRETVQYSPTYSAQKALDYLLAPYKEYISSGI